MTILDAVLLGLLQALGEFLPISSSAHLVLLPFFRGQVYQGVTFDVLLHLATLLAVLLYFAKDWVQIIKNGLTQPRTPQGKILWLLALATLPAAIAGVCLHHQVETIFRNPLSIAACLMLFALLLGWADRRSKTGPDAPITLNTLLLIGCAQALALMPGVSRSGITITAALLLGFSRTQSTRISFLLSAPIIAGAALLEITKLSWTDLNTALICGFFSAFIGALFVIGGLMKYIKSHTFSVFVIYRLLLGCAIIAWYAHIHG
ncbi:MAG: undecaprenyl-diphosphate phosphatase [Elusimicrobiaceae bacterium]|nr:undecaprenyl-diphosphate phosphatase [Elusimicrobiaceae bacterium]